MLLQDLSKDKEIMVQVIWGEKKVEFLTHIVRMDTSAIYIAPYSFNGRLLELNIAPESDVHCHIFGENMVDHTRVVWRNVKLETVKSTDSIVYSITTMEYNKQSKCDERRAHIRLPLSKGGTVTDYMGVTTQVRTHDFSDNGISFYAPANFDPATAYLTLKFEEDVGTAHFNLKLDCKIVHRNIKNGTMFCGCEITACKNDYLLFGCMVRAERARNSTKKEEEKL